MICTAYFSSSTTSLCSDILLNKRNTSKRQLKFVCSFLKCSELGTFPDQVKFASGIYTEKISVQRRPSSCATRLRIITITFHWKARFSVRPRHSEYAVGACIAECYLIQANLKMLASSSICFAGVGYSYRLQVVGSQIWWHWCKSDSTDCFHVAFRLAHHKLPALLSHCHSSLCWRTEGWWSVIQWSMMEEVFKV